MQPFPCDVRLLLEENQILKEKIHLLVKQNEEYEIEIKRLINEGIYLSFLEDHSDMFHLFIFWISRCTCGTNHMAILSRLKRSVRKGEVTQDEYDRLHIFWMDKRPYFY